jgi:hypothetical protein
MNARAGTARGAVGAQRAAGRTAGTVCCRRAVEARRIEEVREPAVSLRPMTSSRRGLPACRSHAAPAPGELPPRWPDQQAHRQLPGRHARPRRQTDHGRSGAGASERRSTDRLRSVRVCLLPRCIAYLACSRSVIHCSVGMYTQPRRIAITWQH